MKKFLTTCVFLMFTHSISSDLGQISGGIKFQKTHYFHYENGFELAYTHQALWSERIQFGISYVTNRLGSKIGTTAEAQDYYHLLSGLYFRPGKYFDPFIQLNLGYYHYSINDEFEKEIGMDPQDFLDNNSPLFDLGFGMRSSFRRICSLYLGMGYRIIQSADLLYPLNFNFGISYHFCIGDKK